MLTDQAPPVKRADSHATGAKDAIAEIDAALDLQAAALSVFFHSPSYDLESMQTEQASRCGSSKVIGGSSAGEIGSNGYQKESITGFSLPRSEFTASVKAFQNLKEFSVDQAYDIVSAAKDDLKAQGVDPDDMNCFALLLVDGLSSAEEPLTFKLQDALKQIPLIGGSAGDGLSFGKTHIYCDGAFQSDAAVLAIIHSKRPWEIFREQHITPTESKLVVTDANPDERIIYEINGEPAAEELARIIGLSSAEELSSGVLAKHPLMLKLGGAWYIRSAHSVIENNALKLFCAIEEGMVLSVGKTTDLPESLDSTLQDISQRLGGIQLTIACDCILRRLELENTGKVAPASEVLAKYKAVGFSTYGEQFGNVHVNQTLTGIVIG